jgi:hypothetical protein
MHDPNTKYYQSRRRSGWKQSKFFRRSVKIGDQGDYGQYQQQTLNPV